MLKEKFVFFREFLLEFQTTGACFPTSKWAAEALTNPLRAAGRKPMKILELGPGTGSVTVKILSDMIAGDTLTICEINPRFMSALKDRISKLETFRVHNNNIRYFECPVQSMPEDQVYDVIVCAIPFLNFDVPTIQEIFEKLKTFSSPQTLMTYYEYIGLRAFSKTVAPSDRKRRMKEIDGYMSSLSSRIRLGRKRVWFNVLPINIYTVKPAQS